MHAFAVFSRFNYSVKHMFLSRLIIALAISIPCLGTTISQRPSHTKKKKITLPSKKRGPIAGSEAIRFLTTANNAFRENGLDVLSEKEISNLVKFQSVEDSDRKDQFFNNNLLLLTDSFISFTETLLKKNINAPAAYFQTSIPNLPFIEEFFLQILPDIAQEAINNSECYDVEALFEDVLAKKASPSVISSLYQKFFHQHPFDFSPVYALCQKHNLCYPSNSKNPSEFVHNMLELNMNERGIKEIQNLSINQSCFTKWMVLSCNATFNKSPRVERILLLSKLGDPSNFGILNSLQLALLAACIHLENPQEIAQTNTLIALLTIIYEYQQQ